MIKYKVFIYLIFIFLSISFIPFILTEIERDKGINGIIMCLSLSNLRVARVYGERIKGINCLIPLCEYGARQRAYGEKMLIIWKAVGYITLISPCADYPPRPPY